MMEHHTPKGTGGGKQARTCKTRRPKQQAARKSPDAEGAETPAFKIRFRGKDGASLSVTEVQQGLIEAARALAPYRDGYTIKWATIYLSFRDQDGREVHPDPTGTWVLHPYKSAADEFGA
jgi:hypothetical protein